MQLKARGCSDASLGAVRGARLTTRVWSWIHARAFTREGARDTRARQFHHTTNEIAGVVVLRLGSLESLSLALEVSLSGARIKPPPRTPSRWSTCPHPRNDSRILSSYSCRSRAHWAVVTATRRIRRASFSGSVVSSSWSLELSHFL